MLQSIKTYSFFTGRSEGIPWREKDQGHRQEAFPVHRIPDQSPRWKGEGKGSFWRWRRRSKGRREQGRRRGQAQGGRPRRKRRVWISRQKEEENHQGLHFNIFIKIETLRKFNVYKSIFVK